MPNRNYQRGRQREYRVIRTLEDAGYNCVRAAGSKGLFDVVAFNKNGIRFVQVKLNRPPSPLEREAIEMFDNLPKNARKEVWVFCDGSRKPSIHTID